MNDKDLFENNCFPMFWLEDEEHFQNNVQQPVRKDLDTLIAELEGIRNTISELKEREWHLDRQLKYHFEGFTH